MVACLRHTFYLYYSINILLISYKYYTVPRSGDPLGSFPKLKIYRPHVHYGSFHPVRSEITTHAVDKHSARTPSRLVCIPVWLIEAKQLWTCQFIVQPRCFSTLDLYQLPFHCRLYIQWNTVDESQHCRAAQDWSIRRRPTHTALTVYRYHQEVSAVQVSPSTVPFFSPFLEDSDHPNSVWRQWSFQNGLKKKLRYIELPGMILNMNFLIFRLPLK